MNQNLGKLDRIFRFLFGVWAIQFLLPILRNDILWWIVLLAALWSLLEAFLSKCGIGIANKSQ